MAALCAQLRGAPSGPNPPHCRSFHVQAGAVHSCPLIVTAERRELQLRRAVVLTCIALSSLR